MGADFAKAALAAGHSVVASGRDTDRVSKALGQSNDLLPVKLDVTSRADAEGAVRAAVDRFGRIDVLVNNAADFQAGFFEEISPEQFRAQIEVNLFGTLNVTRAVLPVRRRQHAGHVITISSTAGLASAAEFTTVNNAGVMLTAPFTSDQREEHRRMVETNLLGAMTVTEVFLDQLRANDGGDLVNISSVAGRVAPAGFAAYAATKWGINGWSEALRVELQPDIRVMVIEPGAIATELSDHITHADSKRAAKEYLDMAIPPHDIADVIAFAISRPRRMTLNEILVRPTAQAM
jgi:NADP-dependent 3-hydroxy acid dehydrogenase YdfG